MQVSASSSTATGQNNLSTPRQITIYTEEHHSLNAAKVMTDDLHKTDAPAAVFVEGINPQLPEASNGKTTINMLPKLIDHQRKRLKEAINNWSVKLSGSTADLIENALTHYLNYELLRIMQEKEQIEYYQAESTRKITHNIKLIHPNADKLFTHFENHLKSHPEIQVDQTIIIYLYKTILRDIDIAARMAKFAKENSVVNLYLNVGGEHRGIAALLEKALGEKVTIQNCDVMINNPANQAAICDLTYNYINKVLETLTPEQKVTLKTQLEATESNFNRESSSFMEDTTKALKINKQLIESGYNFYEAYEALFGRKIYPNEKEMIDTFIQLTLEEPYKIVNAEESQRCNSPGHQTWKEREQCPNPTRRNKVIQNNAQKVEQSFQEQIRNIRTDQQSSAAQNLS